MKAQGNRPAALEQHRILQQPHLALAAQLKAAIDQCNTRYLRADRRELFGTSTL